jgi:MoaA/NifB/PqqE/SkfB family radical SAM enzyme
MIRKNPFDKIYKKEFTKEFPNIIDVELTNNCNLQCKFCSRNIMRRDRGFLTESTFNKILRECLDFSSPIRFIRWGEPFLHPRIMQYSKRIIDNKLPIHITTNGLLINEGICEEIVYMGLDSIIFSMQGVEDTYKYMRGDHYNLLKENILKLVHIRENEEKPYIKITSTMTNETKDQIEEFRKYWSNIVDEVSIGRTNLSRLDNIIPKDAKYTKCKEVYQKLSVDWN